MKKRKIINDHVNSIPPAVTDMLSQMYDERFTNL